MPEQETSLHDSVTHSAEGATKGDDAIGLDGGTKNKCIRTVNDIPLLAQRPSTLVLMMINSCSYVY